MGNYPMESCVPPLFWCNNSLIFHQFPRCLSHHVHDRVPHSCWLKWKQTSATQKQEIATTYVILTMENITVISVINSLSLNLNAKVDFCRDQRYSQLDWAIIRLNMQKRNCLLDDDALHRLDNEYHPWFWHSSRLCRRTVHRWRTINDCAVNFPLKFGHSS